MTHKTLEISKKEARRLVIHQSGLGTTRPFGLGRNAALSAIKRLGYVQIDTISVIQRAHHHVLGSRVPNYRPDLLHKLVTEDKKVFEYWSHAAAFLPMEDFRYSWILKKFFKEKKDRWPKPDPQLMKDLYSRVKDEGPKMARDFEDVRPGGDGWWNLKPAKWALERMFLEGDLVVRERRNFQKVYDLPERVIPSDVDLSEPTKQEFARYLITRALGSHGLAKINEIVYLRRGIKNEVISEIREMLSVGILAEVNIRGVRDEVYYAFTSDLEKSSVRVQNRFKILSPFDNMIIQRERLKRIFSFDYLIECYVPKAKRKYGYFVLPILFGDRIAGRIDTKADRKTGTFIVHRLLIEPTFPMHKFEVERFCTSLVKFAEFNGCSQIQLRDIEPPYLKDELEGLL